MAIYLINSDRKHDLMTMIGYFIFRKILRFDQLSMKIKTWYSFPNSALDAPRDMNFLRPMLVRKFLCVLHYIEFECGLYFPIIQNILKSVVGSELVGD